MIIVKVDRGIAVPPDRRGHNNRKYPFNVMQIGDSFVIPASSRAGCVRNAQKTTGYKFTVRRLESGEYRVWRTA